MPSTSARATGWSVKSPINALQIANVTDTPLIHLKKFLPDE